MIDLTLQVHYVIKCDQYISACNVSGSWLKYDKQADRACRSYYSSPTGIEKTFFVRYVI